MTNHFKIIVPLYNVEKWVKYCVNSIRKQTHRDFQCVIVDDASTDNSSNEIKKYIANDDRFSLIINKQNVGALENIYKAILHSQPSDEDVIVNLDGDDWFANADVLSTLCKYYNNDCWMTYGSHVDYPSGNRSKFCTGPVPDHIIKNNSYRQSPWMTSALRTFKYKLWKNIDVDDLKNKDGNFYEAAWDLAYMFPMLEMAGPKAKFVKEIVYVYNHHDHNDHKIPEKRIKQLSYEQIIRNKKRYTRLEQQTTTEYDDRFIVQDPLQLLSPYRFDVAAKVLYARHKEKGVDSSWGKFVYEHHLDVWGGFTEKFPPKNSVEDFHQSFEDVLKNMKMFGFNEELSYIPVTNNKMLLNGAHRTAAAILYNKPVVCKISDLSKGQINCSSHYFKNKKDIVKTGLNETVGDSIALEYTRLKKTTYMMTLYQHCHDNMNDVINILSKHDVKIVYTKNFDLTENGKLNYILSLYAGEPWIGDHNNSFPGVNHQARLSFAAGPRVIAALVDVESHQNLIAAKKQIRDLIGVGKPSVHTTDTKEETWRNATTCFSQETIRFINNAPFGAMYDSAFQSFISQTKKIITKSDIEIEDICVVGSAPLTAYGKRKCKDFDVLHLPGNISFNENVSSHNQYKHFYSDKIEDIIYNPNKHFYIEGLKFITADGMIKMKSTRGEEKDHRDIVLFQG